MRALALFLVATLALAAPAQAGPEQYSSGKEMTEMPPPPVRTPWYADNEWNVSLWGTYVFTGNGAETQSTLRQPTPWSGDHYLGTDDAWGGGVDLKYFFHRYFGLGLEGYGLAVHRDALRLQRVVIGRRGVPYTPEAEDLGVGASLGTFTLRYPIGRLAPYIFAGGGGLFGGGEVEHAELTGRRGNGGNYAEVYHNGESAAAVGQFGGGLELRVTRHLGWMSDFSWNVVDGPNNNFGMVRSGVNFAF